MKAMFRNIAFRKLFAASVASQPVGEYRRQYGVSRYFLNRLPGCLLAAAVLYAVRLQQLSKWYGSGSGAAGDTGPESGRNQGHGHGQGQDQGHGHGHGLGQEGERSGNQIWGV